MAVGAQDPPAEEPQAGDAAPPETIDLTRAGPDLISDTEDQGLRYGATWRRRRFGIVTAVFAALALALRLLTNVDDFGSILPLYLAFLVPAYAITLFIALRRPRAKNRARATPEARSNLSNRLSIAIIVFIALYIPFSFLSNEIIPYAPAIEFFAFAVILFLLYRLVGRAVGVAPSQEALPPASHRLHKQVVLPIDDPHYQQTLFLNYDFVDKGRGGRTLARRLDEAMKELGVDGGRRASILEDLEDYREGFRFGLGLTKRSRDRRRGRRDRRSQVLRTVYTRFDQELEQHT